jgi:predicted N-acyltransferase
LLLELHDTIDAIDPGDWCALQGTDDPLLSHAWLQTLERSGSIGPGTGWQPVPLVVRDGGTVVAALPLYLKAHSYGEFVYDFAWAHVASQLRRPYYPKLVSTSPLSPVSGARLLTRAGLEPARRAELRRLLVAGAREASEQLDASGVHLLFVSPDDHAEAEAAGFFTRSAWQYHWKNRGYADFDAFLASFASKRRREIRRERRVLADDGWRVEPKRGADLDATDLRDLYRYYRNTCDGYGNAAYLTARFFEEIVRVAPASVVAFFAYDRDGRRTAGTFNVVGDGRLLGRYWGADRDVPLLHFETCLYRMVEWAIAEGIGTIEPGAGGEHKYARGFEPVQTWSVHWLRDPALRDVLQRATSMERRRVEAIVSELGARSPVRRCLDEADERAAQVEADGARAVSGGDDGGAP